MATKKIGGLKACFAGDVGLDGSAGTNLTKIEQPVQGGITIAGTAPTINKIFEENKAFPELSLPDVSSGGIEVSWKVISADDATLKLYFGEAAKGGIPIGSFQGEKTFRFDSLTGVSVLIPRLQYVAVPDGVIGASDALGFSVTGTVLAPKEGEMAISFIETPTPSI